MIKIAIIDDHKIVRDGLKALLMLEEDIQVVFEAADSEAFFEKLERNPVDVILLDIVLPTLSGIEIAQKLSESANSPFIIILSGNPEESNILAAIETGVRGFLPKDTGGEELIEAIRKVHDGQEYFAESIARTVLRAYIHHAKRKISPNDRKVDIKLTSREIEVIRLFFEGLSYKQIAARLFISPRTVESHKNHIMEKLQLQTLTDLFKYALKNGIVAL